MATCLCKRKSYPVGHEANVDRLGSDYRSFSITDCEPGRCQAQCQQEHQCKAWTFQPTPTGGTCWLKKAVPPKQVVSCPTCTSGVNPPIEGMLDRPGGDYKDYNLSAPNPSKCQADCHADPRCQAWTYAASPTPHCWLKQHQQKLVGKETCSSGLDKPPLEFNQDRKGGDYKNFHLAKDDPTECQAACYADALKCKAWTYVAPGIQGPQAHCWLKNSLQPLTVSPGCVSGTNIGVESDLDRYGSDVHMFLMDKNDPAACATACANHKNCKSWTYTKPGLVDAKAKCHLKNGTPKLTAKAGCISGLRGMEYNADRYGGDVHGFLMDQADPALCAKACNDRADCKCWTYTRPGVVNAKAKCHLKSGLPGLSAKEGCISGVKGFEYNMDRPGKDFKDFDLDVADPLKCKTECTNNPSCKSWTYGRPGLVGAKAHCWLKNAPAAQVPKEGCTSGLK